MKSFFITMILLLGSYALSFPLAAQDHKDAKQHDARHIMLNQQELEWKDGPASLPKGTKMTTLEGDLSKEGPFTVRLKLPPNYEIGPHWHPAIEHVTVLEGSFYMGSGDKMDKNKATELIAGGFAVMPIKHVHFAYTKEGATIQLHGIGPWGITYINKADDPRIAQK